ALALALGRPFVRRGADSNSRIVKAVPDPAPSTEEVLIGTLRSDPRLKKVPAGPPPSPSPKASEPAPAPRSKRLIFIAIAILLALLLGALALGALTGFRVS